MISFTVSNQFTLSTLKAGWCNGQADHVSRDVSVSSALVWGWMLHPCPSQNVSSIVSPILPTSTRGHSWEAASRAACLNRPVSEGLGMHDTHLTPNFANFSWERLGGDPNTSSSSLAQNWTTFPSLRVLRYDNIPAFWPLELKGKWSILPPSPGLGIALDANPCSDLEATSWGCWSYQQLGSLSDYGAEHSLPHPKLEPSRTVTWATKS